MSNLSEILQNECTNTHIIYFYREGVFYKAYVLKKEYRTNE